MTSKIPPLTRTIEVPCDRKTAFEFYTEKMVEWWPSQTHSLSQDAETQVIFETKEGGKLYEKTKSGEIQLWGKVLAWEPPSRFVHSWHVGVEPEKASEVEITFTEISPEKTQIHLEHRNWEGFAENVEEVKGHYGAGWESVFKTFKEQLSK